MNVFTFEPGNGVSYRVLFGRAAAATPLIPFYTVFGFGEAGDALVTLVLDTDVLSEPAFLARWHTARHTRPLGSPAYVAAAAFAVFCALTGAAPAGLGDWRADWGAQIPPDARG